MPFYPGPGLGGHCIPIDPFYLTWKAREFDMPTKFIELAGEINSLMPYYVINKVQEALNDQKKSLKGAKVLILGIAYKKDVNDMRESPALKLWQLLKSYGAKVDYHDPHVPFFRGDSAYPDLKPCHSVRLNRKKLRGYDLGLLATNHTSFDYDMIEDSLPLIVDTRNSFNSGKTQVFAG